MLCDPWYEEMADRYGEEYCVRAGYFEETKPYVTRYKDVYKLPEYEYILQFSGAFHPFHKGHLEIVRRALDVLDEMSVCIDRVVIHVDHFEYRGSKGEYSEVQFRESFNILKTLNIPYMIIFEDHIENSCSRNFTRLYSELREDNEVWFLSGGDRANFALTFMDKGNCVIAGRDQSEMFQKYHYLSKQGNIMFLKGNNNISSTQIRATQ